MGFMSVREFLAPRFSIPVEENFAAKERHNGAFRNASCSILSSSASKRKEKTVILPPRKSLPQILCFRTDWMTARPSQTSPNFDKRLFIPIRRGPIRLHIVRCLLRPGIVVCSRPRSRVHLSSEISLSPGIGVHLVGSVLPLFVAVTLRVTVSSEF